MQLSHVRELVLILHIFLNIFFNHVVFIIHKKMHILPVFWTKSSQAIIRQGRHLLLWLILSHCPIYPSHMQLSLHERELQASSKDLFCNSVLSYDSSLPARQHSLILHLHSHISIVSLTKYMEKIWPWCGRTFFPLVVVAAATKTQPMLLIKK